MEEFVYYNGLYDSYNSLLTENERSTFEDYYQEDFSLSEIAEERDISRSAVQKTIKNVLEKLDYYESKLHLFSNNQKLVELMNSNDINEIKKGIEEILSN
jgi:predicted DNA-binding protein YlxM (UPF0122 family)